MRDALLETLRQAQRFGFFGSGPVERAAEHSTAFVLALGPIGPGARLVDMGSGGGLPGLVIAEAFPTLDVLLVDRRQKRTDFLERAVKRLGYDHVSVSCSDVSALIESVAAGAVRPFDIVTARGFGPPEHTLRSAVAMLAPGGRVVISEPPVGDRWDPDLLTELGVCGEVRGAVRVFRRSGDPMP